MPGTLYVVATPLGNLEDLTDRGRRVLAEVDLVACEDTRHSGQLLQRLGLKRPLLSYHAHNEAQRAAQVVERLLAGSNVALISDAGTPCISDPGGRLVRASVEAGVTVVPIPGPSAVVTALSAAGLDVSSFCFVGFLERGTQARQQQLERLARSTATTVFYESPRRLVRALEALLEAAGAERQVCVARELTKVHEEFVRGTVAEVLEVFKGRDLVRGEVTVLVAGAAAQVESVVPEDAVDRLIVALLARDLAAREVRDVVSEAFELPRREAYRRVLALAPKGGGAP